MNVQEDFDAIRAGLPESTVILPSKQEKNQGEHKRRRVTRACDNCRLKKVKCDGKQPCIHCTVYSYNCSYEKPNIRNKRSGLTSEGVNNSQNATGEKFETEKAHLYHNLGLAQSIINLTLPKLRLNLMDESVSQFDLERFKRIFLNLQNKNPQNVSLNEVNDLYEYPRSRVSSPSNSDRDWLSDDISNEREIKLILPSKEVTLTLIFTTWDKACQLFRFYHRPSLLEEVDLLYSLDPYQYTDRQQRFLPLLYTIIACGLLFSKLSELSSPNNATLENDGFLYFMEARKLIDITNVGDIISIQTILIMTIYLQCSARLSTCYFYIGIALRCALKEGLHRNNAVFNFKRTLDPIEKETRKRLFFTIFKMDIYINSLLGLPRSLSLDDIDQELPENLDDDNITHDGYYYDRQNGRLSSTGCANYHTKLLFILAHLVLDLYSTNTKDKSKSQLVSSDDVHKKVTKLELELVSWLDGLPTELKPRNPSYEDETEGIPEKHLMAHYYLQMSYLNCQIMLYRPFIHYVSDVSQELFFDVKSSIRGRNCIKVARIVVKLASKMIEKNLLVGTYWFSTYSIFFSIACLIYYYHSATHDTQQGPASSGLPFDNDLNINNIKSDIEDGKRILDTLKNNSNSSLKIYNMLSNLFHMLNRRTASKSKTNKGKAQTGDHSDFIRSSLQTCYEENSIFERMNNLPPPYAKGPTNEDSITMANSNSMRKTEDVDLFQNFLEPQMPQKLGPDSVKEDYTDLNEPPAKLQLPNQGNYIDESNPEAAVSGVNDYLPGFMDALDTQIFERILPPYMHEKANLYDYLSNADLNTPFIDDELMSKNYDFDPSALINDESINYAGLRRSQEFSSMNSNI